MACPVHNRIRGLEPAPLTSMEVDRAMTRTELWSKDAPGLDDGYEEAVILSREITRLRQEAGELSRRIDAIRRRTEDSICHCDDNAHDEECGKAINEIAREALSKHPAKEPK